MARTLMGLAPSPLQQARAHTFALRHQSNHAHGSVCHCFMCSNSARAFRRLRFMHVFRVCQCYVIRPAAATTYVPLSILYLSHDFSGGLATMILLAYLFRSCVSVVAPPQVLCVHLWFPFRLWLADLCFCDMVFVIGHVRDHLRPATQTTRACTLCIAM